jgi:hypothetical protein
MVKIRTEYLQNISQRLNELIRYNEGSCTFTPPYVLMVWFLIYHRNNFLQILRHQHTAEVPQIGHRRSVLGTALHCTEEHHEKWECVATSGSRKQQRKLQGIKELEGTWRENDP